MRAVVQRCKHAAVSVDSTEISSIEQGALVLIAVTHEDTSKEAARLAAKIAKLRIFPDEGGVMNRSIIDHGGAVLVVSQFTLYGDVRRGNRPSYVASAPGTMASDLYEEFCAALRAEGIVTKQGVFGADMDVSLVNWGPVTIIIDSKDLDRSRYGATESDPFIPDVS